MLRKFRLLITIGCLLANVSTIGHEAATDAEYLGNEGIVIHNDHGSLLFDAFFDERYGNYQLVAQPTVEALRGGAAPYHNVALAFVSHVHGDHFSPAPMLAYLQRQESVRVFAPGQVVDAMLAKADADMRRNLGTRAQRIDLVPGAPPASFDLRRFRVSAVAVPHSGGERMKTVQNLIFRVTNLDGISVAHFGDADPALAQFKPLHGFFQGLDAAFVPYWFYDSTAGQEILSAVVAAGSTVGIHVPSAARGNGAAARRQLGGDAFTDPGERRALKPSGE